MIKKRTKIILIVCAVIVVIVALSFSFSGKDKQEYVTAIIERGKLIQTVSETGTIKASSEIDLNFINTGRISKILVNIGDNVKKDQILAELDYDHLLIQEREAQASLNKLLSGSTYTEIAVKQASVNQAESAYQSSLTELEKTENTVEENIIQAEKTLNDLESDSEDDITTYEQSVALAQTKLNNKKNTYQQSIDNNENIIITSIESELADADNSLDEINTILTDSDANNFLSIKDTSYLINTINSRNEALDLYASANDSLVLAKLSKTELSINNAINDAYNTLNKTFESLNFCFNALESSITSASLFTEATLNTYKSTINSEIIIIGASISNVQTDKQNLIDARLAYITNVSNAEEDLLKAQVDLENAIINARNALSTAQISGDQQITIAQAKVDNSFEAWQVAKAELNKIKAPARSEDVILAKAALDTVKSKINDSIIKATIDGTIVEINYEVGEQTSSAPVISMLGENNFEIEVDISEADIAKINKGNLVEITLDAFGDDIKFNGRVDFIEPAETVIQDVIYYKVKVDFESPKIYSIKSGMTANIIITTEEKENVLLSPSRAIIQKNGQGKFIRVLENNQVREVKVTTGLRGDEGMVEILSGVKEGQVVVTFIKTK